MEDILFKNVYDCGEVLPTEMTKRNYELGVEPVYGAGTLGEAPHDAYEVDNDLPEEDAEE